MTYFLNFSFTISNYCSLISLPSPTKLRRLCYYTFLSVHRGEYPGLIPPVTKYTPRDPVHPLTSTPPGPGTPPDQVHPTDHIHPLRTRYTPQDQYTPQPGTPTRPDQVQTPWSRYTPREQVHPLGAGTSSSPETAIIAVSFHFSNIIESGPFSSTVGVYIL